MLCSNKSQKVDRFRNLRLARSLFMENLRARTNCSETGCRIDVTSSWLLRPRLRCSIFSIHFKMVPCADGKVLHRPPIRCSTLAGPVAGGHEPTSKHSLILEENNSHGTDCTVYKYACVEAGFFFHYNGHKHNYKLSFK